MQLCLHTGGKGENTTATPERALNISRLSTYVAGMAEPLRPEAAAVELVQAVEISAMTTVAIAPSLRTIAVLLSRRSGLSPAARSVRCS